MSSAVEKKTGRPIIIVESPAKAQTIKKYLKGAYDVLASKGHIKDLPEHKMGVDIDRGFRPQFVIIPGRKKVIEVLKKAAESASKVVLAPDPDREGEAIAWHVAEEIRPVNPNIERVLFYEITPAGVKAGLAQPRPLDERMFESQLARRILDRLVGYHISPLLWRKVKGGLSAGRVQSPALRLIVEREREIEAFVKKEYWVIQAFLKKEEAGQVFKATLKSVSGRKAEIANAEEARALIERLRGEAFKVLSVEQKEKRRPPPPPFITSTLQQEASRLLKMSPARTMRIAQTLYEGVDLGEHGRAGLITYMRTDSVRVADEAIREAREEIARLFGPAFVPKVPVRHRQKSMAQDAHEAIRPTAVSRHPEQVKQYLKAEEYKLYELIYRRFLASQMVPAVYDQTIVDIAAGDAEFKASGMVLRVEGFLAAWSYGKGQRKVQDSEDGDHGEGEWEQEPLVIPEGLEPGQMLILVDLKGEQRFTEPPPRYTEASLIRELEERGIGRPSTYATIVSTIQEKGYCEKKKGRLRPTELGRLVNDLLVKHFEGIVDYEFTAKMEQDLDRISDGKLDRVELLGKFWKDFETVLRKAAQEMQRAKDVAEPSGVKCDLCGREMLIRFGKSGAFLGCSGFPECRHTVDFVRDENGRVLKLEPEETKVCPECGSLLNLRNGRYGRFWACSGYPKCKYTASYTIDAKCPVQGCEGALVEKKSKKGAKYFVCSRFPDCRFMSGGEPLSQPCPLCGAPSLFKKIARKRERLICLREGCGYQARAQEGGDTRGEA